jgi:peptidoglycan/LPS O-acetylase OafA/YrhL
MIKLLQNIPQKLARVTSGRKLISEIDGLRFIAIVPVMIQHMAERFERNTAIKFSAPLEDDYSSFLASRGFLGVFIFFVISGFILALPFASYHLKNTKKVSLKDYFWRRITRLEPPYIFWMTVFFIPS